MCGGRGNERQEVEALLDSVRFGHHMPTLIDTRLGHTDGIVRCPNGPGSAVNEDQAGYPLGVVGCQQETDGRVCPRCEYSRLLGTDRVQHCQAVLNPLLKSRRGRR